MDFVEVQVKVCVHSVSLSRQYDVCRHAHPISTDTTSADAAPYTQRR